MTTIIRFAERHKEARERCGFLQKDVAVLLGMVPSAVTAWENEPNRFPETPVLLKLADLYGVSTDWLLGYPDADMLHPTLRGARPGLRDYLAKNSKLGSPVVKMALSWLGEHYPNICTEEFLVRRLQAPISVLRHGNLSGPSLDNLAELTGIPVEFWATGDPAQLGGVPIESEAARLLHILNSVDPPISVDIIRTALPTLRDMALEEEGKRAGHQ